MRLHKDVRGVILAKHNLCRMQSNLLSLRTDSAGCEENRTEEKCDCNPVSFFMDFPTPQADVLPAKRCRRKSDGRLRPWIPAVLALTQDLYHGLTALRIAVLHRIP